MPLLTEVGPFKIRFYTHLAPSGALPQQRDQLFDSARWSQALTAWDALARCNEQSLNANPGRIGFQQMT
jgi:hypothetical protein